MVSILKQIRINLNITQKEASTYLGIPLRTFENWEEGVRTPNKWTLDLVIDKLLNFLNKEGVI